MILVDTTIWADHFRTGLDILSDLLNRHQVLCHPFVIGEIMMGNPRNRQTIFESLQALPKARIADHEEVLAFVEQNKIYGTGVGYVDAHLLAAVRLTPPTTLWTTDRKMAGVAERLGLLASNTGHLQ